MINTTLLLESLPLLARGAIMTLKIAGLSCIAGIAGGTLLGIFHSSKNTFLNLPVTLYVTLIRGTPMLIQIAFAAYVLPELGIPLSPFWAAIVAISANSAAYVSQIVKSGIMAINKGQIEAAQVLGLSYVQTIYYIVLPQAFRIIIPSLGNEFITLVKDSSLASTIGVVELTKEAGFIKSRTFDALTVYCAVACVYLIITSTLSILLSFLEKWINRHAHHK